MFDISPHSALSGMCLARLVSLLPIKAFTAAQAARTWKVLDALSGKAILLDTEDPKGKQTYFPPPPMAGFIEFSMMRIRTDVDQKLLAELYYQYLNVEEDFIKALFAKPTTESSRPGESHPQASHGTVTFANRHR